MDGTLSTTTYQRGFNSENKGLFLSLLGLYALIKNEDVVLTIYWSLQCPASFLETVFHLPGAFAYYIREEPYTLQGWTERAYTVYGLPKEPTGPRQTHVVATEMDIHMSDPQSQAYPTHPKPLGDGMTGYAPA